MSTTGDLAERVADLMRRRGERVAVAESLTGGQVSAALAAASDAQQWFAGAVVAYGIDVKHRVLRLPDDVDPCSDACARILATEARTLLGADIAVATTGVGGPDPQDGHPPGTVYLGWATEQDAGSRHLRLDGDPAAVIHETTERALQLVLDALSSPVESVPAGGAGADSGAADVVAIDDEDTAPIANRSSMNDIPGVGTRGPGDRMDRDPRPRSWGDAER